MGAIMAVPPDQTYATHRQVVPLYHFVLQGLLLLTLIGACVNLYRSLGTARLYGSSLILVLTFVTIMVAVFSRWFALRAQDRAIRAEEQLRHYVLTGRLLDTRLTMRQIIGLRFAGDEELASLAERAVNDNLSEDAIKKAVRHWRADTYRV
jgi:hypothetical protein